MPWYGYVGMVIIIIFAAWGAHCTMMKCWSHDESYFGKAVICWIICGIGVLLIVLAYLNYIPAEAETVVCTCCNCVKQ